MAKSKTKPFNTLANKLKAEDCVGIKEVALELGLKEQRTKQLIKSGVKPGKLRIQRLQKGLKYLYPQESIEKIKSYYDTTNKRVKGGKAAAVTTSSLKSAKVVIQVPIYDEKILSILEQTLGNQQAISKFLVDKLMETAKPKVSALEQAKQEYERKVAGILKGSAEATA